ADTVGGVTAALAWVACAMLSCWSTYHVAVMRVIASLSACSHSTALGSLTRSSSVSSIVAAAEADSRRSSGTTLPSSARRKPNANCEQILSTSQVETDASSPDPSDATSCLITQLPFGMVVSAMS